METENIFDLVPDDSLPFSFKRKDVSEGQIKKHWLEIMKKINDHESGQSGEQGLTN